MGYYTDFELYIYYFDTNCPLDSKEQDKIFDEISEKYLGYEDYRQFNAKWYECEKDMTEFSEKYPNLLFELYGYGEDTDDIWKAYFHNGKSQFCKGTIVYEKMDKVFLT